MSAAIVVGGWLAAPSAALAHGDEGAVPARESTLQAIAYVVNTPGDTGMIEDKIKDAQESEDQTGVDASQLDQAMTALEGHDLSAVRLHLQAAVGAVPDVNGAVEPVLQVPPGLQSVHLATGEEPGTTIVTDEMAGRAALTGADGILLGAAALVALAGVALSARFRPQHSIHALRQAMRRTGG